MSFGQLCDQARFEDLASIAPRAGAPLWFLHIPKTAGSSFRRSMMAWFPASVHLDMLPSGPNPVRIEPDFVVADFMASGGQNTKLFCASHVPYRHWLPLFDQQPDAKLITFLREPMARLISDFRFQGTKRYPRHLEFRQKFPEFNLFYRDKSAINRMSKHLSARPREPVAEIIERLEANFALVGTQESYDFCLKLLLVGLGQPAEMTESMLNVTSDSAYHVDITQDVKDEVSELNRADTVLYSHFASRLDAARPRLEAMLADHGQRL